MKDPVRTLRIDGIKTIITPKPDDAELAAQALLESRITPNRPTPGPSPEGRGVNRKHAEGTPEYYKDLSEKIKAAHEADKRAAMRYVAYVEQELARVNGERLTVNGSDNHEPCTMRSALPLCSAKNHEPESIATLERGLYQHQDAIEREGGDLKQRWQKCLALVIVKQMTAASSEDEDENTNTDDTE